MDLKKTPHFRAQVTPEIIASGVARNSNHCMVAEAIKAAYPKLSRVSVDIQTIRASNSKKRERYVWLTPRSVQKMIIDFDMGRKIKPFAFGISNGQTTAMRNKTDAEKAANRDYYQKKIKSRKKAQVDMTRSNDRRMPHVVGGKAPPRSVGARRTYGLRALEY